MKSKSYLVILLISLMGSNLLAQQAEKLNALEWRFIGPIVGNRGSVVLGHPTKANVFYHGASNGLWKTEDAGTYWEPVGDKDFHYGSIGCYPSVGLVSCFCSSELIFASGFLQTEPRGSTLALS